MRYYLAGKMTGLPKFGYDIFEKAAADLRGVGLDVASPHEIEYHETEAQRGKRPHSFYMKGGLLLLLECDGIILMPRWSESTGAKIELRVALDLSKPAFYYAEEFPGKIISIN